MELPSAATTATAVGSGKIASTAKPNDALADQSPSVANQEKLKNSLTAETTDEAGITTLAQRLYTDLTIESRIEIETKVTVSFQDDLLQRPLHSSKHDELQDDDNDDDNFETDDDDDDENNEDDDDDDGDSSNDEDDDVGDEDDDEGDNSNDENDDDVGDEDYDDGSYGDYDDGNGYGDYDDY